MITLDNNNIRFDGAGLFSTQKAWIHPERTEKTYEIIYVVSGNVYLKTELEEFSLEKKDLIILPPGVMHCGFRQSAGHTSFYWVHFYIDNPKPFFEHSTVLKSFSNSSLFKELLHFNNEPICPLVLTETVLSHILAEIFYEQIKLKGELSGSKLTSEVYEYIRINADRRLSVFGIARMYGYNPEHLSRLMKIRYKKSLKALIDDAVVERAKDFLVNSLYSIKEISTILEFKNPNSFINFYKYHEHISPAKYRNSYHKIHMNNK